MDLKLFHYWRSSSSWRVRWALFEKGIACDFVHVNLLESEQLSDNHDTLNPAHTVPVLVVKDDKGQNHVLSESVAIIEWIEESFAGESLLPEKAFEKAHVRRLTQFINAGVQPLQNLSVLKKLDEYNVGREEWSKHWITKGLEAYEKIASQISGQYSFGDALSMADLFLIPQLYNARRFHLDLNKFPTLLKIEENCMKRDAAKAAHPDEFKP